MTHTFICGGVVCTGHWADVCLQPGSPHSVIAGVLSLPALYADRHGLRNVKCFCSNQLSIDLGSWVLDCFSTDGPAQPPTGALHEDLLGGNLVLQMKPTRAGGAHLLHLALQLLQACTGLVLSLLSPKASGFETFHWIERYFSRL